MSNLSGNGKEYTVQPNDTLEIIWKKTGGLGYKDWKDLRDANLDELFRVGRLEMERLGIGPTVNREPCGLRGHSTPSHKIIKGIHYDHDNAPTIYVGTTFSLKYNEEPPPKEEPEEQEPQKKEEPQEDERWTGVEQQSPGAKLELFTTNNPGKPDITYSADGAWTKLLSYSFSESVDDLEGSFSFSVENEEVDTKGNSVFDLIPIRSIVKIYEGAPYAVFVGIIRRRRLGVSMTSQGVKRTISFSGKSIISCITDYTVSLDVRIPGVTDAAAKTNTLKDKLAGNQSFEDFLAITWDYFTDVSKEVNKNANGIAATKIADIIETFIGTAFVEVSGKERHISYDIATVFFNAANNSIVDIWRNILPKPVYEVFSRCNKGKPKIVARQAPFGDPDNGNDDWKKLDAYLIAPISLISYDLEQSDEELYTFFASYIIGSARERNFYMAASNSNEFDTTIARNSEKVGVYGFRPLELSFFGYNRQGNTKKGGESDLPEKLTALNKRACYWFSRLDDMYSGSITICTDFNEPETNPRIGCRAKFLGGEFYITRTDHSWNYGGTPTIKLSLSRGLRYDENGKIADGDAGLLKHIGNRFRELERST